MKKNDGESEDNTKFKKMNNWGISNMKKKLKLKNFNCCWWRIPPYKNDDFRHRVQLS